MHTASGCSVLEFERKMERGTVMVSVLNYKGEEMLASEPKEPDKSSSEESSMDKDRIAPDGMRWVCAACGKTAKDRYGGSDADPWWDVSCTINSVLVKESQLVRSPDTGRVVQILEDKDIGT